MEQLSGNNFDALFQKAAEEYPLKTDNKNWDIVAAKLHAVPVSSTTVNSRKWQYAVLLLLLLFCIAGGFFVFNSYHKPNAVATANNTNSATKKSASSENTDAKSKNNIASKIYQNEIITGKEKNVAANKQPANNFNATRQLYKLNDVTGNNKTAGNKQPKPIASEVDQSFAAQSATDNKNNQADNVVKNNDQQTNNQKVIKPAEQKTSNKQPASVESQQIKLGPQPKTIYGELFFSPDFSTVKFQHVNKPGYKIGIALGYRINKRISAELGLQRLHNKFYSDARYLNKSNIKLKPNTTLQSVNGIGKLTEIPFDIKYNFSKKKEQFFVTAGTTIARITHSEKYNYNITKDGTPREFSRRFGALTGTKFFSDINFSAGYQTAVSRAFNLKIEPYFQTPLKGLGIGNLPVSNFGMNVGIIKNLK